MLRVSMAITLLAMGLIFSVTFADDHSEDKMDSMEDMEMGAPPQMKELAYLEGDWNAEMEWIDMQDPNKWNKSKGSGTYNYVLDGCAIECHFQSEMMGMPFTGYMIISYDRDTGQWQQMWIDTIGGKMSFYKGKKADGKTILMGEETWYGKTFITRTVVFDETDTSFNWEMDQSSDGGKTWVPMGKAVYKKKM